MIDIKFSDKIPSDAENLCVFVSEDGKLSNNAMIVDKDFNGLISKFLKKTDSFSGKFGQIKLLTHVSKNESIHMVILIGVGKDSEINDVKIQELGGHVASGAKASRVKDMFILTQELGKYSSQIVAAHLAFGASLGSYSFDKYFTTKKKEELPCLKNLEFFTDSVKNTKGEYENLEPLIPAIFAARDVISEPGNVLYPESYAEIIASTLEPLGVFVEVIGEREMKNLGLNALLGVGQGSTKESKLVVMRYNGGKEGDAPVAFVGKGVTFDTGGISIKPSRNMGDMKYDMAGSAAVFGTIYALAKRGAKVNAVGVVGLVENMPGGNAQRPGDIVTSMSGQTIEVLDTDAEGRLVLADALWYTQDKFKPKFMVDLATLTGAVSIALGNVYAGLFSNNDSLAENLLKSGKLSGEELWRLPLHSSYESMIKSSVADVANLGNPPGHASSSIGGQFLQKFVNNVPWAHLDIAGVANDSKGKPISPKGAVGFGIRLLNKLVSEFYEQ
jgi:leucyl aminopeptidase